MLNEGWQSWAQRIYNFNLGRLGAGVTQEQYLQFLQNEARLSHAALMENAARNKDLLPAEGVLFRPDYLVPDFGLLKPPQFIFEFIGMPGAGKTAVFNFLRSVLGEDQAYWVEDQVAKAKRMAREEGETGPDYEKVVVANLKLLHLITFEYQRMSATGQIPRLPVISERSLVDLHLFNRAKALNGDLIPSPWELETDFVHEYILDLLRLQIEQQHETDPVVWVIINLMVPPEVTLHRKERRGSALSPEFLQLLYAQYLQYHNSQIKGRRNSPLYYLSLNTHLRTEVDVFAKALGTINEVQQEVLARVVR